MPEHMEHLNIGDEPPGPRGSAIVEVLGPFSSHPLYAPLRLVLWYGFAIGPLVAGVALFAYWLSCKPDNALSFLINYGPPLLLYGLGAFVFAIGLGVTAATTTCLARGDQFVRGDRAPWTVVIAIVVGLFCVGMLTWLIPYVMGFPPRTRAFVGWIGLLPLFLLVMLATFVSSDEGTTGKRRRIWSAVVALIVTLALMATRVQAVADWFITSNIGGTLARLIKDATPLSESALDPAFHAWVITGLLTILTIPMLALVLTIVEALSTRWLSRTVPDAGPSDTPPSWPSQIRSLIDPEGKCGDWQPHLYQTSGGSARAGTGDPACNFFGGFTPTVDQAAAFRRITATRRQEYAASLPVPSNDLIIEGARGSGRTSTASAAILHEIIIDGSSVLLLVPTASKRRIFAGRLRESSRLLGLAPFIDVTELTPREMTEWVSRSNDDRGGISAKGDDGDARIPDVIVGTLADFESQFFSQAHDTNVLTWYLHKMRLIVVEDVDQFSVQDRLHMPYMLAKLRLILGSMGHAVQTLVIAPPLAHAANALIAKQLLMASGEKDPVVLLKAPRPLPDEPHTWIVPLTADSDDSWTVESLLETCGRACAEAGIDTVVYSPLLSEADRNNLQHRCIATSGGTRRAKVNVITDVDEWHDLPCSGRGQIATILHSSRDGATVALAVIGMSANSEAVVFSVSPPGVPQRSPDATHGLIAIPGRASRSLFAQHYASASRFITRLHPAPRALWTALGFPRPGQLDIDPLHWKNGKRLSDRMIWLDPPDPESVAISADPVLWPWATMAPATATDSVPSARPVDILGTLDRNLILHSDPGGSECQIVLRSDLTQDAAERRDVLWVADDGTEYGREDLAYLSSLRLRTDSGYIVPARIEATERGPVQILGRPWSAGRGDGQAYMPLLEIVDLELPASFEAQPLLLNSRLSERVAVYGLVPPTGDSDMQPAESRRQFAEFHLRGIYDGSGKVRQCDATIRYEASKFVVLFDPSPPFDSPAAIRQFMFTQWGHGRPTTHEIVPELGAAITYAMSRQAPGLEQLVKCIGVRIRHPDREPQLGLVFVEPRSTESSGFALMEPIVCDGDVMAEFFANAAAVLEQCQARPSTVFARAESCTDGSVREGLLSGDASDVDLCARLLRSIAGEVARR